MSKHVFRVEATVDDEAMRRHNEQAKTGHAIAFDTPDEWEERDLVRAVDEEIATIEITDYEAG